MAAPGVGTVKAVIDDVEFELVKAGVVNVNRGRLFRLAAEAEKDFSYLSGCVVAEASKNTTAGTYDYDIQSVATAITNRISRIWAVSYLGSRLRRTTINVLNALPDFYEDEEQDLYAPVGNTKIRLGFNPATGTGNLEFLYGYEITTVIEGEHSNLTIPSEYYRALEHFMVGKYLLPLQDMGKLASSYLTKYKQEVQDTIKAMTEKFG